MHPSILIWQNNPQIPSQAFYSNSFGIKLWSKHWDDMHHLDKHRQVSPLGFPNTKNRFQEAYALECEQIMNTWFLGLTKVDFIKSVVPRIVYIKHQFRHTLKTSSRCRGHAPETVSEILILLQKVKVSQVLAANFQLSNRRIKNLHLNLHKYKF